ncbi:MAG: hypothetical protein FRX49_08727 [Trebouxia sp. A1-2]|nr:MAG: hypothetical protein FRX49_08727 [Trebouxia sp. A1-2]
MTSITLDHDTAGQNSVQPTCRAKVPAVRGVIAWIGCLKVGRLHIPSSSGWRWSASSSASTGFCLTVHNSLQASGIPKEVSWLVTKIDSQEIVELNHRPDPQG